MGFSMMVHSILRVIRKHQIVDIPENVTVDTITQAHLVDKPVKIRTVLKETLEKYENKIKKDMKTEDGKPLDIKKDFALSAITLLKEMKILGLIEQGNELNTIKITAKGIELLHESDDYKYIGIDAVNRRLEEIQQQIGM